MSTSSMNAQLKPEPRYPAAALGVPQVDGRIVRAMRLLEQHASDDVDFESVAAAIHLSVFRFHHLFVEATGVTPGSYLREIRLNAAARRLRWTKETIGTIASTMGYESQAAFNRAFVKRFGVTPGRFRKDLARSFDEPVDALKGRWIRLRQSDSFHCLAKRYFGSRRKVRDYWADFLATLPADLDGSGHRLFLGLDYGDVYWAPETGARYDCCVVISETDTGGAMALAARGLDHVVTRAGLYACVEHEGRYTTIEKTYSLLDKWLAKDRYTLTDDPTIELYGGRQSLAPDGKLNLSILLPLY